MTWLNIKNLVELLKHIILAILQGKSSEEYWELSEEEVRKASYNCSPQNY